MPALADLKPGPRPPADAAASGASGAGPPAPDPGRRVAGIVRVLTRMNVGGPAMHVSLLARGLDSSRWRTRLVVGSLEPGEGDMSWYARERGVDPVLIPSLRRPLVPGDDLRAAVAIWRVLRSERPTLVHTHSSKAGALTRPVSIAAGVPLRVHTFHGHVFHGYFDSSLSAAAIGLERALARMTHAIVAVSEAVRDDIVHRYAIAPARKVHVVPLGLDLARHRGSDRHRGALRADLHLRPGPGTPLVGWVGRLAAVKRGAFFLEMIAALRTRPGCQDAIGVIVGGGDEESALRDRATALGLRVGPDGADGQRGQSGPLPALHFLGWRRDLDRIFPDLDVVVSSSHNEGTPVALIEAAAAGRPIVARRVGGVADTLGHGRYGVPLADPDGDDPAAFAAVVASLLADRRARPGAHDLSATRRDEIVDRYGADRLCAHMESLYAGLLSEHHISA